MKRLLFVMCIALWATPSVANESVEARLDWFLSTVGCEATHRSFWADDLIYTSSTGERFGKPSIVDSMSGCDESSDVRYSASDVTVRMINETALLTFKLLMFQGTEQEPVKTFLNSGVLVQNKGKWQATQWQATVVPTNTND